MNRPRWTRLWWWVRLLPWSEEARWERGAVESQRQFWQRHPLLVGDVWSCHICGAVRPDAYISVFRHQRIIGTMRFTENVRYCNDRPACLEGARTKRFTRGAEDER